MDKLEKLMKYKASFMMQIELVECIKETEKTVTLLNGRKANKRSDYENYFDTFEDAKKYCIYFYKKKVCEIGYNLEKAKEKLLEARELCDAKR